MIDWSLIGAPLLAGVLVVSTHVVLGRRVLERGIIFIDLAVAQVAALGVILADAMGWGGSSPWVTQLAAATAALSGAAALTWSERRFPELQEALIGSLYVLSASVGLLLLAHNPHGAEAMQALVAGQILWLNYSQLLPVAALYLVVLIVWATWARHRPGAFYFLFAVTVTASVQLVGVFLVFATLILPALAGWKLPVSRGLALGFALGVAAYAAGLLLSLPTDLPSGPLIVCMLAGFALLAALLRRFLPAV